MANNVYDIQKNYTQVALDWIQEYQGDFSEKNKKELLELLQQTEQEFIHKIQSLTKETIQDKGNRKLLSMTELKYKLIQDIANQVIGGTEKIPSLRNMKQLVNYIAGGESEYIAEELVENLSEEQKDIPLPDIQGTIEQIGEVILPPDILERFENSYTGGQQQAKKRPAGFDKIGLIEQLLSDYLGRERTTFIRKTGILRLNQMRQVSYYHLYLSEIDKTLLLNNQYGEGCFILDGDFDIWEAKKSDIKGTEGVVMISFDYNDPMKFLDKLKIYLGYKKGNEGELLVQKNNQELSNKKDIPTSLRKKITQDELKKAIIEDKINWMNLTPHTRPKYKIRINGEEYSYIAICRIFGIEGKPKYLFKDDVFSTVTEKIFGKKYMETVVKRAQNINHIALQTTTKKAIIEDKINWMNLNTATRPKYKIIINGEEYGYIAICRIFGIEGEPKDLCKDDVFSTVTEKIFEISWINYMKITTKEAIIQDKINWMNLNTQTRPKYKIIINGEEYGYIAICRIFGIEGEPKDLYKDDKFHQLTEKILGSNK